MNRRQAIKVMGAAAIVGPRLELSSSVPMASEAPTFGVSPMLGVMRTLTGYRLEFEPWFQEMVERQLAEVLSLYQIPTQLLDQEPHPFDPRLTLPTDPDGTTLT
jgi:hypothetical protein